MMKSFKKILCFILAAVMLCSLVACDFGDAVTESETSEAEEESNASDHSGGGKKKPQKKPDNELDGDLISGKKIVLGMSAPLTGSAAFYGTSVKNGAQMAVDEINEAHGDVFELVVADDNNDASKVASVYEFLMEKGMQVSLGAATSNPCLEFAAIAKMDSVFVLTPTASATDILEYENANQMCYVDGIWASKAASYIQAKDFERVGIFYRSDDIYSYQIKELFVNIPDLPILSIGSVTGMSSDLGEDFIRNYQDCDVIFMPVDNHTAADFMKQAKGILSSDILYLGADMMEGIEDSVDGFDIDSIPQEIVHLAEMDFSDSATMAFAQKYRSLYGSAQPVNRWAALGYDSVYAIFEAMIRAAMDGKTITSEMSAEQLCVILTEQFSNGFSFSGVTGDRISWTKTGEVQKPFWVIRVKPKSE